MRYVFRKSFSDTAWIRRNLGTAIVTWVVTGVVASGVVGALVDPNTYEDQTVAAASSAPPTANSKPNMAASTTSARSRRPSSTAATPSSTRTPAPTPRQVSYPGKQKDDIVAGQDRSVRISGYTMTLGQLRRVHDPVYGYAQLCSSVRLLNRDTETQSYDDTDFAIQYPNGNVQGSQLVYSGGIGSGELVHNGTTRGRVCFVPDRRPGLYIVTWGPDFLDDTRAV